MNSLKPQHRIIKRVRKIKPISSSAQSTTTTSSGTTNQGEQINTVTSSSNDKFAATVGEKSSLKSHSIAVNSLKAIADSAKGKTSSTVNTKTKSNCSSSPSGANAGGRASILRQITTTVNSLMKGQSKAILALWVINPSTEQPTKRLAATSSTRQNDATTKAADRISSTDSNHLNIKETLTTEAIVSSIDKSSTSQKLGSTVVKVITEIVTTTTKSPTTTTSAPTTTTTTTMAPTTTTTEAPKLKTTTSKPTTTTTQPPLTTTTTHPPETTTTTNKPKTTTVDSLIIEKKSTLINRNGLDKILTKTNINGISVQKKRKKTSAKGGQIENKLISKQGHDEDNKTMINKQHNLKKIRMSVTKPQVHLVDVANYDWPAHTVALNKKAKVMNSNKKLLSLPINNNINKDRHLLQVKKNKENQSNILDAELVGLSVPTTKRPVYEIVAIEQQQQLTKSPRATLSLKIAPTTSEPTILAGAKVLISEEGNEQTSRDSALFDDSLTIDSDLASSGPTILSEESDTRSDYQTTTKSNSLSAISSTIETKNSASSSSPTSFAADLTNGNDANSSDLDETTTAVTNEAIESSETTLTSNDKETSQRTGEIVELQDEQTNIIS